MFSINKDLYQQLGKTLKYRVQSFMDFDDLREIEARAKENADFMAEKRKSRIDNPNPKRELFIKNKGRASVMTLMISGLREIRQKSSPKANKDHLNDNSKFAKDLTKFMKRQKFRKRKLSACVLSCNFRFNNI